MRNLNALSICISCQNLSDANVRALCSGVEPLPVEQWQSPPQCEQFAWHNETAASQTYCICITPSFNALPTFGNGQGECELRTQKIKDKILVFFSQYFQCILEDFNAHNTQWKCIFRLWIDRGSALLLHAISNEQTWTSVALRKPFVFRYLMKERF